MRTTRRWWVRTGSYPDGAIIAEELLEWLASSKGGGKEGYRSDGVRPTICAIAGNGKGILD